MELVKDKFHMNRMANCRNEFQGEAMRVLCVCSAGLLRSPTAAVVLSQEPYNYNTRAAGLTPEFALIPVDHVLLNWADVIVCMSADQARELSQMAPGTTVVNLDIPDQYAYRDPELMRMIAAQFNRLWYDVEDEKKV